MNAIHTSVPSENWDDDFEFQQNSNATNAHSNAHSGRPRPATSRTSEDWDRDHEHAQQSRPQSTRMSLLTVLEDKKNTYPQPATPLGDWAEPGPSTPIKQRPSHSAMPTAEIWDDDFEDGTDSPVRRSKKRTSLHSQRSRSRSHPRSRPGNQPRHHDRDRVPDSESWDDDFDHCAVFPSMSSDLSPTKRTRHDTHPSSEDDNITDEDEDFGFADKEEDRTVTARSRRAALSRLTSSSSSSPPPPVPALPPSFALSNNPTSLHPTNMDGTDAVQPFPRSPTASVFSVPTSGRDSVAFSYYTSNSTTHLNLLRPTHSRTSVGGLANLPPSPPIHKERERRRLRKKSRPPGDITFELKVRNPQLLPESSTASGAASGAEDDVSMGPPLPSTPTSPGSPESNSPSSIPTQSPNNSGKTALLSRIGSVKKWGARKKGASLSPGEVALQERNGGPDIGPNSEHDLTPRPTSSLSASSPTSNAKSHNNGFFFRTPGGFGGGATPSSNLNMNPSSDSLSRRTMHSPTSGLRVHDDDGGVMLNSPSKLVKRKSFGFVQIRRGNAPLSAIDQDVGEASGGEKRPMSMQPQPRPQAQTRHAAYAGLGYGRTGTAHAPSVEDLTEIERDRKRSISRSRERHKEPEKERGDGKDKAKDGSRGFMGSVRKISLAGRHKWTKSNAPQHLISEEMSAVGSAMGTGMADGMEPLPLTEGRIHLQEDTDVQMSENMDRTQMLPHAPDPSPPTERQPTSTCADPMKLDTVVSIASGNALSQTLTYAVNSSTATPMRQSPSPTKSASTPQSASLGRSTGILGVGGSGGSGLGTGSPGVPRRNSLGDLKIPARITQAQVGLKRDLGMVREFATSVEQLKDLQSTYHSLVSEVQTILDSHAHMHTQQSTHRATSPNFFNMSKQLSRPRSNTNPAANTPASQLAYKQLTSAFYTINSKYRISWECAELLIELGSGTHGAASTVVPPTSVSAPAMQGGGGLIDKTRSRERAITLAGDEASSKPPTPTPVSSAATTAEPGPPLASPPNLAWRASTGRHDLSQRQLALLKEMLSNADSPVLADGLNMSIPEEPAVFGNFTVNRDWRWGDAMTSTVTLPSEESASRQVESGTGSPSKKRRRSRLGMRGLRDMLKSLKRSHSDNNPSSPPPPISVSSVSLSTDSSVDSQDRPHEYPHPRIPTQGRRRAKTSTGPESLSPTTQRERDLRPTSPYSPSSTSNKASPRRPSLASIFRIGQRGKTTPATSSSSLSGADVSMDSIENNTLATTSAPSGGQSGIAGEDDWDRMDSASDLDVAARSLRVNPDASATVRATRRRSPYIQPASMSQGISGSSTPKQSANASQSSIRGESPSSPTAATLPSPLSQVESMDDGRASRSLSRGEHANVAYSLQRPPPKLMRGAKTGSVRSMPPQSFTGSSPDPKLAMTPENIKPLLENAKELHARLDECIREIRSLLTASS